MMSIGLVWGNEMVSAYMIRLSSQSVAPYFSQVIILKGRSGIGRLLSDLLLIPTGQKKYIQFAVTFCIELVI